VWPRKKRGNEGKNCLIGRGGWADKVQREGERRVSRLDSRELRWEGREGLTSKKEKTPGNPRAGFSGAEEKERKLGELDKGREKGGFEIPWKKKFPPKERDPKQPTLNGGKREEQKQGTQKKAPPTANVKKKLAMKKRGLPPRSPFTRAPFFRIIGKKAGSRSFYLGEIPRGVKEADVRR